MQKIISKYGLAAHLAFLAVAPLFLSNGAVLPLALLSAVWLVMQPSRVGSEMLHEARKRVVHALMVDPLFWVLLTLVVFTLVRSANTGIQLAYDAEVGRWFVANPIWPLLPGSVEGAAEGLVGCALSLWVVVTGCRHALGRSARGAFCFVASGLAGLGGLVLAFLHREGVASVVTDSACSLTESSYLGAAFGVYLSLSLVALSAAFMSRWLRILPLLPLCVAGNAVGLFAFAPPAVVAAFSVAILLELLYVFVYLRMKAGRTTEFKYLVIFGFGLILSVLATMLFFTPSFVESRVNAFLDLSFVPKGFVETRAVLSDLAARVWRASPWLGTGVGSFALDLQYHATPADWAILSPLQKAVPNGYWMLIAERGVIGAFVLGVVLVLLVVTYVHRLVKGVLLSLPDPLAWAGLLMLIVAGVEMLVDVSFLSPGAMVALLAVFSLSASAFPRR